MKKWTTVSLIATGTFGVLRLILSIPGLALSALTGIVFLDGAINFFVVGVMFPVTCLVLGRFGAATFMSVVFSVLALPLPLYGTPGFLPKVVIGAAYGLIADVVFFALRRYERLAAIAIGAIINAAATPLNVWLWSLLGLPGAAEGARAFLSAPFLAAGGLLGAVAGYVGWLVYDRIREAPAVVRIRGE